MSNHVLAPICRHVFETAQLVSQFPPRLQNGNKKLVYRIACPPGCVHGGRLEFSRWPAPALPLTFPDEGLPATFEGREDVFAYEPVAGDGLQVAWHVNFAHFDLFCAYGSSLFAQDEMQVAEHPALGSLREALLDAGIKPLTVENDEPTPVLVTGAERRCRIATDRNAAQGRPFGLYGNHFARGSAEAIERAATPIMPPTITNLIAMEAPACGSGRYTREQIEYILRTACTGFSAARLESVRGRTPAPSVVIHTGFWGCGAYGGSRVLMALLQLLAARLSQVDRLVFHTVDKTGTEAFTSALRALERDLSPGGGRPDVTSLLNAIHALGFEWGVSDGT